MFKIKIFDVDQGNCAYLVTPNGESIVIDASHHRDGYYPREEIKADLAARGCSRVSMFVNSNADHDHVSDLKNVRADLVPIRLLKGDVSSRLIRDIKEKPLTEGLEALCRIIDEYVHPMPMPDTGGVEILSFNHPFANFGDTNNASIVTFYFYGSFGIVFPGDMERAGWDAFLLDPAFIAALKRTKVFVASHHGREGGYCKEVFDHCKPDLVVISDKPVAHETQNHNLYGQLASGLMFGDTLRKVVTTRSDGSIQLEVGQDGGYTCRIRV